MLEKVKSLQLARMERIEKGQSERGIIIPAWCATTSSGTRLVGERKPLMRIGPNGIRIESDDAGFAV